jgi:hypothetical protein
MVFFFHRSVAAFGGKEDPGIVARVAAASSPSSWDRDVADEPADDDDDVEEKVKDEKSSTSSATATVEVELEAPGVGSYLLEPPMENHFAKRVIRPTFSSRTVFSTR